MWNAKLNIKLLNIKLQNFLGQSKDIGIIKSNANTDSELRKKIISYKYFFNPNPNLEFHAHV